MLTAARVNTAKAPRRTLTFATLADLRAELDRVEAAQHRGALRTTGNWTPGQILHHLSSWACFPYDGYPTELRRPPALIRLFLRLRRNSYFNNPFPAGFRIPGVKDGTVAFEDRPFDAALAEYRRALDRLESAAPVAANPVFGPLSHDLWITINVRHAELHLGFLTY